jgi:hypothetical protein
MGSSVAALAAVSDEVSADAGKTYVGAQRVRERYGNVSDMWLWRKLTDPDSDFPRPILVAGRRLWDLAELDAWDAKQPRWQPPEPLDKNGKRKGNPVAERRRVRAAMAAAEAVKAAELALANAKQAAERAMRPSKTEQIEAPSA